MTEQDGGELSSRDRILRAAMQMFGEDRSVRLSVRAVAARAGVSMGSLRYHFPTQQQLREEVLSRVYDLVFPDDGIHDTTLPARDRLIGCLQHVLSQLGTGARAREANRTALEALLVPEPAEEARRFYAANAVETRRRVEYWLTVLAKEGALPEDDIARRTSFLLTVVNGLGLERALPSEGSVLHAEADTLHMAVDAVLHR